MRKSRNKFLQLAYKINSKLSPIMLKAGKIVAKELAGLSPEDALAVSLIVREIAKTSLDFAIVVEHQTNNLKKE